MPIDRQVMKSDDSESKSLEFQHQPPVTEVSLIIDDWTRKQQHLAGVFSRNLLQKCSLLLVGQIIDTFDGRYHVVTPERNVQKVGGFESGISQIQRFRASNRYIADVGGHHRSCSVKNRLGEVTFATTKLKNR